MKAYAGNLEEKGSLELECKRRTSLPRCRQDQAVPTAMMGGVISTPARFAGWELASCPADGYKRSRGQVAARSHQKRDGGYPSIKRARWAVVSREQFDSVEGLTSRVGIEEGAEGSTGGAQWSARLLRSTTLLSDLRNGDSDAARRNLRARFGTAIPARTNPSGLPG